MNLHRITFYPLAALCLSAWLSGCAPHQPGKILEPSVPVRQMREGFRVESLQGVMRINIGENTAWPVAPEEIIQMIQKRLSLAGFERHSFSGESTAPPTVDLFLILAPNSSLNLSATLHVPKSGGRDIFRLYPPKTAPLRRPRAHPAVQKDELETVCSPLLDQVLREILSDLLAKEPLTPEDTYEPSRS